ncbi:MAG TPA: uracil-DNA glycosylase, partial [Gemmatimonadales bacterium]|nr:uracil-DNA glycosylase [Gemmatimonadales bacterium]
MADEWRRYLEQQMELGGAEVVLSGAVGQRGSGAASPLTEPSPAEEQAGPLRHPASATGGPAAHPPASGYPPRWKQGAPPIPAPGIAVESPGHSLGDELLALQTLDEVAERIRTTHCCGLCPNRTHAVPGDGNPNARLVLIGEGPGATEDAQGKPFVGQAGNLLNGILEAIEVPRDSVYITNIVKCRPPQNRKPLPDEIAACIPYLHRQLEIIRPKVIVTLGSTAAEAMLGVRKSLGELRNKVHTYNGIPLVVTYHPAALLRNPNWKKPTWDDVRI